MILGIGTDLVRIERLASALERFGERFTIRIFTAAEIAHCRNRPPCLAKRFAAKEAFAKALGTGFRDGIWFREIGVEHDALERPALIVSGNAARQMSRLGVTRAHLSLSDEEGFALAMVILEGNDR
ncbi:MAG: holo-ACP synthase [Magnetococcales bacterium]|nr:holo-ACP synthase [Magnetococcales bacterium]